MTRVSLVDLAHARSGDKGDTVNIGLIAYRPEDYPLLVEKVTAQAVKAHFGDMVGRVERFELSNVHALNFLCHEALDGGGTVSMMNDAQGKTFSTGLLRMEIEVPDEVAEAVAGRGWAPRAGRPGPPPGPGPGGVGTGGQPGTGAGPGGDSR